MALASEEGASKNWALSTVGLSAFEYRKEVREGEAEGERITAMQCCK